MMRANPERRRGSLVERLFDGEHGLSRRNSGAISDAENMGINGKSFRAERGVHHHIGGLAANARQRLQRVAICGYFAPVVTDQYLR